MALSNEEILEAIASKSVLEISELIKLMEEKFGVSAAAPVAVAAAAGAIDDAIDAPVAAAVAVADAEADFCATSPITSCLTYSAPICARLPTTWLIMVVPMLASDSWND